MVIEFPVAPENLQGHGRGAFGNDAHTAVDDDVFAIAFAGQLFIAAAGPAGTGEAEKGGLRSPA